jgi:hypothetical protein
MNILSHTFYGRNDGYVYKVIIYKVGAYQDKEATDIIYPAQKLIPSLPIDEEFRLENYKKFLAGKNPCDIYYAEGCYNSSDTPRYTYEGDFVPASLWDTDAHPLYIPQIMEKIRKQQKLLGYYV